MNNKEIFKKIFGTKNAGIGASNARPSSKARPNKKTILITLPILLLLIAALIAVGITIAAGNNSTPETEQTFTEEGDGYYIWVRAVDHAGNKGPWSEAQRVWIETGKPTITLKSNSNTTWARTGSVTVAIQDSKSGLAAGASVKYGWSESLDTEPSSYTTVTPTYTEGTTSEVTFTAEASGLTGQYYLWVVPTTLTDTAGNTQTATVKSTGQFYFDNEGPTVGTLTMKLGSSSGSAYTAGNWTNQSVYVAVNNGSDNSGSSTTTWTIDGTTQTGTNTTLDPGSGASKTYTIIVTTTDGAGNTATLTSYVKIDKLGPTAPTISGGSTSWATSRTIKVDTASTDTGVGTIANYEYYCGSSAPTASTGATASLAAGTTSVKFSTNYNGYYVSFRAVDGVGNKGTWSSTQRLYIDTVSPTVTANNTSITITQGDSKTFASLFTVTWGGITTGTQTYTLNNASTSYTNTNQLAVGTHTLKCTANKNNGTSAYASVTITVKAKVTVPEEETCLAQWNNSTFASQGGQYKSESCGYSITSPASASISIPEGVSVLKVTCYADNYVYPTTCGIGWSEASGSLIATGSYETLWGYAGAMDENSESVPQTTTAYVGVTPGKTYIVQYEIENIFTNSGEEYINISYSASINNQTPTVESY